MADAHRRHVSAYIGVDTVACDYVMSAGRGATESGEEASGQGLPVSVHKFYGDCWVTAHVVPRRGPDPSAVRVVVAGLEASGLGNFVLQVRWCTDDYCAEKMRR